MSLINQLPTSARPIQTESIFTATFNTPTIGKYDFNTLANRNVKVHDTNSNSVYFLDRMNFSLDIDEGLFKTSIEVVPTFSLKSQNSMQQKLPTPIPLINYVDNTEYQYYYEEPTGKLVTAGLSGVLNQTAPLVGIVNIKALVQLNIYEVRDMHWIQNYNALKTHNQGKNLLFQGCPGCNGCEKNEYE